MLLLAVFNSGEIQLELVMASLLSVVEFDSPIFGVLIYACACFSLGVGWFFYNKYKHLSN